MYQLYDKRDLFTKTFSAIYAKIGDSLNFENDVFKYWRYEDDFYLLHKKSGVVFNWYKHLGRSLECNREIDGASIIYISKDITEDLFPTIRFERGN